MQDKVKLKGLRLNPLILNYGNLGFDNMCIRHSLPNPKAIDGIRENAQYDQ